MILKDTFFEYDVQNENGRIYTKDVVVKMIEQFNARPVGMFGELHHTDITNVVSLKNASHIVTELHLNEEKSTLDGTIEILDTPTGNTIKHLMEKGMKWNDGFKLSPRGIGHINEKTKEIDTNTYELISFDIIPKIELTNE